MQFAPAIPILRIFSVDKAREFYLDFLGFQLDWEHRFAPDLPLYMQIHRDGLILHLSEHHGDATPGSAVTTSALVVVMVVSSCPYSFPAPRTMGASAPFMFSRRLSSLR